MTSFFPVLGNYSAIKSLFILQVIYADNSFGLCKILIQYIFFLKFDSCTTLPYSKIGLTKDLKSGTILSLFIY